MKRILIMLAAVGILLLMASCGRDSARVEICSDGSWLGDYTITGDQVDFFCTVKIKNTGSEEQSIIKLFPAIHSRKNARRCAGGM